MHNSHRLVKGKPRCTLRIHPDDARTHAVSDGEIIEVRSRVGALRVTAEVTDEMMPGVVSLPHGWGHHRSGSRLRVAEAHPGVSANDLTDAGHVDALSGNARFNDVPVTIHSIPEESARVEPNAVSD